MNALSRLLLAAACAALALAGCGGSESGPADASCPYPCGTKCCSKTQVCDFEAETCSDKCEPSCDRRSCGDDGCGGSCGTCGSGTVCSQAQGQCVVEPGLDAGGLAPDAAQAPVDAGATPADAGTSKPDASAPKPCDPYSQTGCTGSEKCTLVDFNTPGFGCGPGGGTLESQATCTYDSDCKAGLVCVDFGSGLKCHGLCNATTTCPTGQECWGVTKVGQTPFICLPVTSCDPLAQDCPESGQGCYPLSGGADAKWACFTSLGKTAGQSCKNSNECVEGYVCHALTCKQLCNPAGGAPACTTGTCQTWNTLAGYCQ